jgi:anti-anti-sigma factor
MESYSLDTSFRYAIEPSETRLVVHLRGWMGYESSGQLASCWEAVRSQVKPEIALDLGEVICLASAALGSILALRRWLVARGCCLRVIAVSSEVREIIKSARLMALLPSEDEAYASAT